MTIAEFQPTRRALLGAAALLALPARLLAQASTLEPLARRLVAAIADPATDAAIVATLFAPATLERRPVAEWLSQFAELRAASGGMTYRGLEQGDRGEAVVVVAMQKPGLRGREARLTIATPTGDGERLSRLFVFPRPAPYPGTLLDRPVSRRQLAAAIEARVRWSAERDEFSGAVLVTAPDGSAVYDGAFGTSRDRKLQASDRFHLGSADKSFTALMIGRMVAEGRLRWDRTVAEILPDYPHAEAARAITVEHLVTHRAGLGGLFERPDWDVKRHYPRVTDILPVFAAAPLRFAPGTQARYSNEGFVLLGAILEKVDGRSWYDQLAERIYAPAGMNRSAHLTADENPSDKVVGRRFVDDDALGLKPRLDAAGFSGWRGNSCGGGYSTVADMNRYLHALRGNRLTPAAITARMTAAYPGGVADYGMGFHARAIGGQRFVGHSGGGLHSGIDGDSAIAWDSGWAVSVLGNYDSPFAAEVSRDIKRMLAAQAA